MLKWSLVRYLHPVDNHQARITKNNKYFTKELDFKYIKFSIKIRDIREIAKNNSTTINVFCWKKSNLYIKNMI